MTAASADIVIVSAVRTAIGGFGGSLKDHAPADLGALVLAEAAKRAHLPMERVEHVVMGQVIPSGPQDAYLARVAAVRAGVPHGAPALTLNRLCGSGVEAIITAARLIAAGEVECALAGGAESMSRAPHILPSARWGQKMGDAAVTDALVASLTDPFQAIHMGVTAENVARLHGIDRDAQDALAHESHARAARAIAARRFVEQILPVEVKSKGGVRLFAQDEHVRLDAKPEDFSKLKPVFQKDGTVTAGNASGVNDGAAALTLMSAATAATEGVAPLARLVAWGHAGLDPAVMGLGPVHAVPKALARAGLRLEDMDVIESNEAFAAQACAVTRLLGFDPAKVNPNGSGIALGHPVGATGAMITVKALYELHRIGGRYGLITMCIGGGQGIALIIERL
jgi:acetyl-CoA C-acetyltransferase